MTTHALLPKPQRIKVENVSDDFIKTFKENKQYEMRLKMFVNAVEKKEGSAFIHKYAKQHSYDVLRAINEGYFTKQQAVDYLDMENWV